MKHSNVLTLVLLTTCLTLVFSHERGNCGYFKKVSKGADGHIKSPNYPNNYPNKYRCIWLIQAPDNYKFNVTIPSMSGEENSSGTCVDYLEIRNGASDQERLYHECDNSTELSVETESRWLWVKFQSDEANRNTGFRLTWDLVKNSGDDHKNPIATCQAVNFQCANKECIPTGYLCDNYMDCGCLGEQCDEHESDCRGFDLTQEARIGIGITVGFAVFTPLFFGIGFLDIWLKKRATEELASKMKEARLQEKRKKMGALVTGTMASTAASRPVTAAVKKA